MTLHYPTTNKSLLVQDYYKGLPLLPNKQYRDNNINKANSILALALEKRHNFYYYEVYDKVTFTRFSMSLTKKDAKAHYLQVVSGSHIKLVIFTSLNSDTVENFSAHDRNTKLNLANAYQIKNEAID